MEKSESISSPSLERGHGQGHKDPNYHHPDDNTVHTFSGPNQPTTPSIFNPNDNLDDTYDREELAEEKLGISRTRSTIRRMQTGVSFFNERLKGQRKLLFIKTLLIYALMGCAILGIFSIYWGSSYQRGSRLKNLRMLVVIEDDQTVDGTQPYIGNALRQTVESREAMALGHWIIANNSEFTQLATKHGHDTYAELQRQVHHQRYWMGLYVPANATVALKNAIDSGNSAFNMSASRVVAFYETGRDMSAMNQYVIPNTKDVGSMFLQRQPEIMSGILGGIDAATALANPNSIGLATSSMEFHYVDARPMTDAVLMAPLQVGLIYMIIVTFFGFNFFGDIHRDVIKAGVKKWHLLTYRVTASICSFFFISLFFSFVTLAFQVEFSVAFGKSGFLVYWMTTFLTMCAVGCMNEAMAMLCIIFYPPLLGFWLLFWVVSNISATFSPIALCPRFYRYTYGMPIHAAYEINKVIFFNTYKGAMGRNFAVIIIWAVIGSAAMAIVFFPFKRIVGQRALQERRRIELEVLASQAKDEEGKIQF